MSTDIKQELCQRERDTLRAHEAFRYVHAVLSKAGLVALDDFSDSHLKRAKAIQFLEILCTESYEAHKQAALEVEESHAVEKEIA